MKNLLLTTAAVLCMLPTLASAEAGEWIARGRMLTVVPQEDSSISAIGGHAALETGYAPELDFSYFFTNNIAAELILATVNHDVKAKGTALGDVPLGDVWLLPPTLTVQYHFTPDATFRPYVGAGVNYTIFWGEDKGAATSIDYDNNFGVALQAGADYMINENWGLNLDVKRLWLNTDVTVNGAVNADVDIDPWIIGVGVAYHF